MRSGSFISGPLSNVSVYGTWLLLAGGRQLCYEADTLALDVRRNVARLTSTMDGISLPIAITLSGFDVLRTVGYVTSRGQLRSLLPSCSCLAGLAILAFEAM